jgi:hypothetical protein
MRRFLPAVFVTALVLSVTAVASAQAAFVSSFQGRNAVIWAVGDAADGGPASRGVAAQIAAGGVDRLLYLGDVYESGTAADFALHYEPLYGALGDVTAPTPGNHEWPNRVLGYNLYWLLEKGVPTPPWYAFKAAGWQILSLNSEAPHGPGSEQLSWLSAKLDASKRRGTCRLAFWHRPRYSAGAHGDQADVAPLWDALRGRAGLILNGHDHNMQRFAPTDGIVEIIAGAGGRSLYPLDSDSRLRFANSSTFGALRLKLSRGLARFASIAADGTILDSGRVRCTPAAKRRHSR